MAARKAGIDKMRTQKTHTRGRSTAVPGPQSGQ